jgi:hypothetical protein
MGTITGINDLDPVRWKNSQWRNLQVDFLVRLASNVLRYYPFLLLIQSLLVGQQVGWDESAAGERRNRVSIWEIEPVAAPFFICPPPFFGAKRPRQLGRTT